ncbi:addiction module antitoxin [Caulobacter segnis]|uniref:ribbon-helix-helix domain-containing protein n=1 Tax=Caulobacter segnis TaxID=88688 RepID=UPI00240EA909|nr:addiction module antitoxin [Caulobacter segnis]MDG2520664.1 addiction module antitoxin [Caulobacter segnis]
MPRSLNLNVRVTGPLSDYVSAQVGANGAYENVSEYVRDLIRRDKSHADQVAFDRLKAEITLAFSAPDEAYETLDAATVITRNSRR